jgi:predicted transcriptional regulator
MKDARTDTPSKDGKKVRLTLDLSPELDELVGRLAKITGGTKSDVMRKSIALMELAVEAKQAGKKFGIAHEGQTLATEIVGV